MNIYFLVEGKRTEKKVYPKWLSILVPQLVEIDDPRKVASNNYYMFSGNGYPALLSHVANAIKDINEIGKFDYFVICLDADEVTVEQRNKQVLDFITSAIMPLNDSSKLVVILQNRCIETWFLGNSKVLKKNPDSKDLREYIGFYDVSINDPELMPNNGEFETTAQFHESYLKEIFSERGIYYSKKNPGGVTEAAYLKQLIKRANETGHIGSIFTFLNFCKEVKSKIEEKD